MVLDGQQAYVGLCAHPNGLVPRPAENVTVTHSQHAHIVFVPFQRLHALQCGAVPHLYSKPHMVAA